MTVTYREGVAILQVVAYAPIFVLALLLNLRHGFAKSSGWFFLITFSIIRLAGAIAYIVYCSHPSIGAITTSIICNSIGLSPLTLVCLGLLSRANDFSTRPLSNQIFRIISFISLLGLVLGITGGTLAANSSRPLTIKPESKAAILIFTAVFLSTLLLLLILYMRLSSISTGERRILFAVAISSPFIAVRLVYALITEFSNNSNFNPNFGSTTIYLCMAVLEEIIVVLICAAVGFTLKKVPKGQFEAASAGGMADPEQRGGGKSEGVPEQMRSRKTTKVRGPISWLFVKGRDAYRERQERAV